MKVLGIDTSSYANAVGIVDGNRVLADFAFEAKTDSLEKIVANIDFALKEANLLLEDIEGLGIGLGPGSWTGIRVGVALGKILAFSASKPVAGVPTLEALAYSAGNTPALLCPIISAGTKDIVYAAFYHTKNGVLTRVGEYYVGDVRGLSEIAKEPTVFIGSGVEQYSRLISRARGSPNIIAETIEDTPKGSTVALLAGTCLERGESDDALSLEPLYLKESTARAFLGEYTNSAKAKG